MMCENFRIAGTGESILEFSDPMSNILAGDDVQNFDTHRVVVLLPMRETSQGRHTGKLSGDSEQVKTTSALYNQETIHKNESTSYIRCKNMVNGTLNQVMKGRNFGARNDKIASEAPTRR